MANKIKKLKLYYRALYKGELLKKIEYKIKDIIKYFYIRNKIDKQHKHTQLKDIFLNINNNSIVSNSNIKEENIKIFNEYSTYENIKDKLNTNKVFWRKVKLSNYNDVKTIWEYNRLQYLLPLALKYIKTRNDKYKDNIVEIIKKWEKSNEYEYSINWNSNLEVAKRAINISLTLMILSDQNLNQKYSNLLYLHAKHIYHEINYSNCCIPNNHVIGEATALLLLSQIIDTKENKKWYRKSTKILEKYLAIIDKDGVSIENSFTYQWFVTKMYILSLCFINNTKLFNKINTKINKSLNILKYIYINKDIYLNYGDNDDGFLYSTNNYYNIVEDIKQYYDYFSQSIETDELKIYKKILEKFNQSNIIQLKTNDNKYFCNKKIFIYKDNENLIFFNAKNIEGHAHNDSLAINLIINKKEILLDSGTFSYNLNRQERSYYRGRESHTTIQLEDNNATEIGTFRWINNIKSYVDNIEENNEYIRVSGLIEQLCSREIKIYKNKNLIEISDYINKDKLKTNWIMSKNSKVNKNKILIENVEIKFNQKIKVQNNNIMISKEYFSKKEAKKYTVESSNELITTIKWNNK